VPISLDGVLIRRSRRCVSRLEAVEAFGQKRAHGEDGFLAVR